MMPCKLEMFDSFERTEERKSSANLSEINVKLSLFWISISTSTACVSNNGNNSTVYAFLIIHLQCVCTYIVKKDGQMGFFITVPAQCAPPSTHAAGAGWGCALPGANASFAARWPP
jgi:hypothetical protein